MVWVAFNVRKPPLNDVRVRKAIAYAIDRNFIVNNLHAGLSTPATGPIVSSSPFFSADVEKYDVDLKKANALLDEADYPKNRPRHSVVFIHGLYSRKPGAVEIYRRIHETSA